uniref:Uncharacterized protein n=1 Tax=Caudovirales sp. ctyaR3 TaxID=2827640 RepID=A0A8S5T534_9CAUD|nr:MAG TPA: hypothetical protein [Caudovirales sp. ctyaR3]
MPGVLLRASGILFCLKLKFKLTHSKYSAKY